jgi:hypothetical protein
MARAIGKQPVRADQIEAALKIIKPPESSMSDVRDDVEDVLKQLNDNDIGPWWYGLDVKTRKKRAEVFLAALKRLKTAASEMLPGSVFSRDDEGRDDPHWETFTGLVDAYIAQVGAER